MSIFWIEATSTHKIFYAVEAEKEPTLTELEKQIDHGSLNEVVQQWGGEVLDRVRQVTPEEYIQLFDKEHQGDVFVEWDNETKMNQITSLEVD